MAIAQAMCTSFKQELMLGTHNFATNGNAFKLALYAEGSGGKSSTTATLGAATTAYTTTGEVANSGSYAPSFQLPLPQPVKDIFYLTLT